VEIVESIGRRQVLLRAWDTDKEEMVYDVGAYCNDITTFWFSVWEQWYINTKYAEDNRFIVMYSVGTKDMNGKDVFEGDIIKYRGYNYFFQGVVVWDQTYNTIQGKEDWHTKNYKSRTMQMTPVLEATLHDVWRSDSRCEYVFHNNGKRRSYIDGTLRSVCKRAGLVGVTLHTLRHTFASHLVLAGVTLREVQELMGHQSFETTLLYAHLSEGHVKKQVMRLPFAGEKELKPVRVLKAVGKEG